MNFKKHFFVFSDSICVSFRPFFSLGEEIHSCAATEQM